jgi:ubiquinone/menaquinone biosynthesis C-methylase UbiE
LIRELYERHVLGSILDFAMKDTGALRRELLAPLGGRVVEIGFGTGTNLPYFGSAVDELVAVEPSHGLLERAAPAIRASGLRVSTVEASATRPLPIDAGSADAVVITFVLCSVSRVPELLAEAKRLLKPGAPMVTLEHVVSPRTAARTAQRAIRPVWRKVLGGCDPTFDARAALDAAGFDVSGLREVVLPLPQPVKSGLAGTVRAREPR